MDDAVVVDNNTLQGVGTRSSPAVREEGLVAQAAVGAQDAHVPDLAKVDGVQVAHGERALTRTDPLPPTQRLLDSRLADAGHESPVRGAADEVLEWDGLA